MTWYYAGIMGLALAVGSLLLRRSQARLPLAWWQKLGLAVGAFCGAMLGAKLPFVLSDWEGLLSGSAWWSHGKTILCGLIGGYLGVELAKWSLDVRIKTGDTFVLPVAAAVAIGRLACFAAGCCYGSVTDLPWGVVCAAAADEPGVRRHPTQLYEAAFHLLAAAVIYGLQRRGLFRGQLIKLYILAYLGYRLLTEFIRPEPRAALGLTGYQWGSLVLIGLFAWLWWRDRRLPAVSGNPAGVSE
jgi:phosphatidylglycerol:prolipoprotein diacylglycerol transferase